MMANAAVLAADEGLTDESIISRVLSGEQEHYEILVRRYNSMLYKTAKGILSDESDIEDAMQEAYVKGYEKLYQFKGYARFSTWLTRILINCALRQVAKAKGKEMLHVDDLNDDEMAEFNEFPNETLTDFEEIQKNLGKALEAAILQLPAKYRSVFIMREVEKTSVTDTAYALDISEENVKIRLHRAKKMLKEILQSEAATLDVFKFYDDRCSRVANAVMGRIAGLQGDIK